MSCGMTFAALATLYAAYTSNKSQEKNREQQQRNQNKREAWQTENKAMQEELQEKEDIMQRNEMMEQGSPQLITKAKGLGLKNRVRRDTLSPKPSSGLQKQSYGFNTGYAKT